ncbi:MAG: cation:proton antiporter [Burkholderiales bacterium]|nr:cation:proton antiporter [Phycisphaerae bacterium]
MKDPGQLAILLLQIATIIALSRAMGMLFSKFRQPQVIGEILAGIMLGPSLLGWVWPAASTWLFPAGASMTVLSMLAQVGVLLFLFLVGLEFDPEILRQRGKTAAAISISGIVVPLALGFAATYPLRSLFDPAQQAHLFPTALFMGAAMSVTAFPVLARIVTEWNLQRTEEGGLAIAAAAVDDVLAWTMLAAVVAFAPATAISHGDAGPMLKLLLAVAYVGAMLLIVKPFLKRIEAVFDRQGSVTPGLLAILLLTLLLSSFTTEMIGVHALFGAFVAGLIMPKRNKFVHAVTLRLETFSLVFLLPTFFAFAGLKADLRTMLDPTMIGYTLLIILIACVGKLGGVSLAARWTGLSVRKSVTLGVLMNTRGLMELIILTVGLQLGVINQRVYSMMVIMAIVTTAMAAPLIQLLMPRVTRRGEDDKIFSILIPVAKPKSGGPLIELAAYLTGGDTTHHRLCAVHLTQPTGAEMFRSITGDVLAPADRLELEPLLETAREKSLQVEPMAFYSRDVPSDIARIVRQQNIDLLLMGYHLPVFGHALLGGIVHRVLTGTDCDVAVFVERGLGKPSRILVPFMNSSHDRLALDLAGKIAKTTGAAISIIHVSQHADRKTAHPVIERAFQDPTQKQAVTIKVVAGDSPASTILDEITDPDLVIIGVAEEWGLESSLLGMRPERIAQDCPASMLIVRRYAAPKQ